MRGAGRHAAAPNGYELRADIVRSCTAAAPQPPSATELSAALDKHELQLDALRPGNIIGVHACDERGAALGHAKIKRRGIRPRPTS